jgi:hypothetical protein
MSTWRCGWICPCSYFFAAIFLAGASFAVLLAEAFLANIHHGNVAAAPIGSTTPGEARCAFKVCVPLQHYVGPPSVAHPRRPGARTSRRLLGLAAAGSSATVALRRSHSSSPRRRRSWPLPARHLGRLSGQSVEEEVDELTADAIVDGLPGK